MLRTVHKVDAPSVTLEFEVDAETGKLTIMDRESQTINVLDNADAVRLIQVVSTELQKHQDAQPKFTWPSWLKK